MYFTAFEALEPADFNELRNMLEETRLDRGITPGDLALDELVGDLVNLWLSGFRGSCELKAMLEPLDNHLIQ